MKASEVLDRAARTATRLQGIGEAQIAQLIEKYYATKHEESLPNLKAWLIYQASRKSPPIKNYQVQLIIEDLERFEGNPAQMREYLEALKMLHRAAEELGKIENFNQFLEAWKRKIREK